MGDKSKIEWTEATWNPIVGCSKVSPGCAHCYAEELHRTRMDGRGAYPAFKPWTPENAEHNVTLVPERLEQPLRWQRPRMVFVNSMSDLFHPLIPSEFIERVFAVMLAARQHTFQVLTKRPERMAEVCSAYRWPLPNVWLGTSIENRRFVHRADHLRATPAAVRFISAEPLLGPLIEDDWEMTWADDYEGPGLVLKDIDWLIVGGESGPGHRPMDPEWVRFLRDACLPSCGRCERVESACECEQPELSGGYTAFFFKQWGGRTPKAGGRELDGRTWDEMPAPRASVERVAL